MKLKFWLFSILTVFLLSCQSVPQDVAYFQDFDKYAQQGYANNYYKYEPTIKNNDQLLISISSPVLDQRQVAQFNLPMNTYLAPGETTVMQSSAIQTYTVDTEGYIHFPVIGKIKIAGLTKSQGIELLENEVSQYLPSPIVNLQIISFKVTVLGEVLKPGPVEVTDERVSILDAIGAVGDLTVYGDRKNVKLIRDNNGVKELHTFDLTKSDIFNSPYYYLQQNDVVYIEPNKTRKTDSTYSSSKSYELSTISVILSSLTALSTIVMVVFNVTKD
ncbi:MAG: polysaccharide biosynthesis/export family protein [Candidatus Symbiothrix sp.]|jgi:polysaccharide export outer membrane protein|nr:polysaccharide biosynthesis/export family protein [Candidatus Symbiothrix sp.]